MVSFYPVRQRSVSQPRARAPAPTDQGRAAMQSIGMMGPHGRAPRDLRPDQTSPLARARATLQGARMVAMALEVGRQASSYRGGGDIGLFSGSVQRSRPVYTPGQGPNRVQTRSRAWGFRESLGTYQGRSYSFYYVSDGYGGYAYGVVPGGGSGGRGGGMGDVSQQAVRVWCI